MWKAIPEQTLQVFGNALIVLFTSYVSASVCSAAALMLLVDLTSSPQTKKASTKSNFDVSLPSIESPNYFSIRQAVIGRNIFNSKGEIPDETSQTESEVTTEKVGNGEFRLDGPCLDSKLPLKLSGTIYMGQAGTSLASVVDSSANSTDTYKVGDAIIDFPGAEVALVERKRVVINNNGVKECLTVDYGDSDKVASVSPVNTRSGSFDESPPISSDDEPVVSENSETVVLTSSYVESQLGEGFGTIIQAARLVPKNSASGGDIEGFKIFAIKANSILSKIGFKNGDIITRVNDTSMKRPDQGFALYQSLQDENEIVIQVLRGGKKPTSLKVQIK